MMRPLPAAELLMIWERGAGLPPYSQALLLLDAAIYDTDNTAIQALSIGQRDGHLLTLREWTFGAQITSLVTCPACDESVELQFYTDDIRVIPADDAPPDTVEMDGYRVEFRLPNSADLIAAADDPQDVQALLRRCLIDITHNDEPVTVDALPEAVVTCVAQQMADADPQADVRIETICPGCENRFNAAFDIVSFFWAEIDAWARRTLRTVHRLARAYGWREADILAMSATRRELYLGMLDT